MAYNYEYPYTDPARENVDWLIDFVYHAPDGVNATKEAAERYIDEVKDAASAEIDSARVAANANVASAINNAELRAENIKLAIEQKGRETIATIPDDYAHLTSQINGLAETVEKNREDFELITHNITRVVSVTPEITLGKRLYLNEATAPTLLEVEDANANYLTLNVKAGQKYLFSGRFTIYISGVFLLDEFGIVKAYEHYNTYTENVADYVINVPNGCDVLKITYSIIQPMHLKQELYDPVPNIGRTNHVLIVDPHGNGDYTNLSDACAAANGGDTVFVYPGTYREQLNVYGKELYIVGVNKYKCILIDSSSDYRTPPLQANWGSISNFTIIEDAASPAPGLENEYFENHPVKNMAYCIHSDNGAGIWTTERTYFVVDNCILKNANRPCIGAGTYPFHSVIVKNCEMHSGVGVVEGYKRGALYFHNNQSTTYVRDQNIVVKDCIIKCDDERAVYALDTNGTGTFKAEIINNTVYSAVNGVSNDSVYSELSQTKESFLLEMTSHGNNIANLNY